MTTHTILVATDLTDESLNLLRAEDGVAVQAIAPKTALVRDALKAGAQAMIIRDDLAVDADMLEAASGLKVIARMGASLGGVDVDAATQRGVMVMNTPGTNAIAAGEHALTLMLALSRRLISAHNSLKDGYWLLDRKRQAGTQLHKKTLGIIGLGRVGRIVAGRALAFGMSVLAYDPYVPEDQIGDERITLASLKELAARSDFISLHIPITSETRGMINAELIKTFKPGMRLINTAHGAVWDENAVADALKSGQIGGVAVDVFAQEPPYSSPLIGLENVIHTPHIGDNTVEAAQDLSIQIVQQTLDALRGTDYRNVVNLPFMPGVEFEYIRPYLALAERVGVLHHVLARHPVRRVAVEYRGEDVAGMVKPLTVALLKGLLTPVLGDKVSYINAPLLANERGIQLTQAKGLHQREYGNVISVQVTLEDGEETVIAGTLLDRQEPHIIQINQYRMNFVPEGYLLILGSFDQPGVIGRIGTLMANNQVNIASWHTGRAERGGQTLTVVAVDQPIPEPVMTELCALEFVRHAHQIAL